MKQDIYQYMTDSFVDYKGEEHQLIACAYSSTPEDEYFNLMVSWNDPNEGTYDTTGYNQKIVRYLSVGIAVCNPCDKNSEEIGKKIARGRAEKETSPALFAVSRGSINRTMVEAFLKQELAFAKNNPEKIIKGYNESKRRYEERQKLDKELKECTSFEMEIIDKVMHSNIVEKCIRLAKKLKNYEK